MGWFRGSRLVRGGVKTHGWEGGILFIIETYLSKLSEIVGDVPLTAAEERLIAACGTGEVAWFGDERPTTGTDENTIRATLIRHILLGGCDDVPVHAKGVQILGAWITGVLDLQSCDSSLNLYLSDCYICAAPILQDARLGSVMLPGCEVPGLKAHRLTVARGVLLNNGFKSKGTVNLSHADIRQTLSCVHGTFDGRGSEALNCEAIILFCAAGLWPRG